MDMNFYQKTDNLPPDLRRILATYEWTRDTDLFVHVRPPRLLNLPEQYYVGDDIDDQTIQFDKHGCAYWHRTDKEAIYSITKFDKKGQWSKEIGFNHPRFVVDTQGTDLAIGAFMSCVDVPRAESLFDLEEIDVEDLIEEIKNHSRFSHTRQWLSELRAIRDKKRVTLVVPDLKDLLDSIPDED